MNYQFIEEKDDGTYIVAELIDNVFSGEDAVAIEKILRQKGWPDRQPDPMRILHGSRLWAIEMTDYVDDALPLEEETADANLSEIEAVIDEAFGDTDDAREAKDFYKGIIKDMGGAGSGFYGHAGRDAENLRGGSVAKGKSRSQVKPSSEIVRTVLQGGDEQVVIKHGLEETISSQMKDAGVTVSLMGDSPTSGYMVGKYKKAALKQLIMPIEDVTTLEIDKFLINNAADLRLPNHYVGGWLNEGKGYLETSINMTTFNEAVEAGFSAEQIAIFDLNEKQEVFMDYSDLSVHKAYIEVGENKEKQYVYP